jgi:hypothetical protein
MRSEMDVMRLDERQRLNWLLANRVTLMTVGVIWLLMMAFEFSEGRAPWFHIAMVPVFAGLRLGLYFYYARDRDLRWVDRAVLIGLVTLGHWIASMTAWVQEFTTAGFPWFVPAAPSHGFWSGLAGVLAFPLLTFITEGPILPEGLGVAVTILNSLIWGGAAYLIVCAARRRASQG